MPEPQQLPLSGPTFSRALNLARQAVIDAILGGPGVDAEPDDEAIAPTEA